MLTIFEDMLEEIMEVFMDDFSIFGDSFVDCLQHLKQVLICCEETNLMLNWKKIAFYGERRHCVRAQDFWKRD